MPARMPKLSSNYLRIVPLSAIQFSPFLALPASDRATLQGEPVSEVGLHAANFVQYSRALESQRICETWRFYLMGHKRLSPRMLACATDAYEVTSPLGTMRRYPMEAGRC